MSVFENQIYSLLKSKITANNNLAFQLIQSQWNWSTEEALKYILLYQINNFWTNKISNYTFEVDGYTFMFSIVEDDDIYVYGVDLFCTIQTDTKKIFKKKYLGTFDYNFGFGAEESPTLLESKDAVLELFDTALKAFQ